MPYDLFSKPFPQYTRLNASHYISWSETKYLLESCIIANQTEIFVSIAKGFLIIVTHACRNHNYLVMSCPRLLWKGLRNEDIPAEKKKRERINYTGHRFSASPPASTMEQEEEVVAAAAREDEDSQLIYRIERPVYNETLIQAQLLKRKEDTTTNCQKLAEKFQ